MPEKKHKQRHEKLKPALDVFFAWLETVKEALIKGEAIVSDARKSVTESVGTAPKVQ